MEVLRLEHVSMNFGKLAVLQDLSFSVSENSVFGFIGKNGSGKTTTMKMILGFLKPIHGNIFVCGEKVTYGNTKTNRYIGYLPDVPEFYGYMTPKEYLTLCGEISGLHPAKIKSRTEELLHLVGLEGINRKISGFSRGMKQRLGIAQALVNQPKILICDEPTSALDPVGRKEILEILQSVKDQTTVVFSSHILDDVERICDHIGILDKGKMQMEGNLTEIKHHYHQHTIRLELFDKESASLIAMKLKDHSNVLHIRMLDNTIIIQLKDKAVSGNDLLANVLSENVVVKKYEMVEPSLENVFLKVVK